MESKYGQTASGSNRVIRGGSWNNNPQNCRVAYRNNNTPGNRNNNIGFRLANTGKCARNCRLYGCGGRGNFLSSPLSCVPRICRNRIFSYTVRPVVYGLFSRTRRPHRFLFSHIYTNCEPYICV
ncbi:MAG: SUMF1/EgtB/PvdO family nonheme iron enzyme [Bacteroidota bacterium]